jgi:hypothetical protein
LHPKNSDADSCIAKTHILEHCYTTRDQSPTVSWDLAVQYYNKMARKEIRNLMKSFLKQLPTKLKQRRKVCTAGCRSSSTVTNMQIVVPQLTTIENSVVHTTTS